MARSRSNGDINTMPKMPQGSCLISLKQNMRCHSTELTAEYLAHNTIIKNIADIFRPVVSTDSEDLHPPRVILIDGALGIGKTYLCKEIAYQWSQGQILTDKRFLFLLHAHDPRLQSLKHVKDLVALFCELENEETIDMIYGHIKETQGEILTILLDGYDEFYGGLQSNHLLSRMIRCEILPKCGVVITSRSFACASLCGQADRRMEILGFTSNDRQDYIQRALEKNPADIATLTDYFDSHPTVDSLCHIPLNMTILLRLFTRNDSILPQSRTELYENFVSWTITYHIEKDEKCTKSYKGGILSRDPSSRSWHGFHMMHWGKTLLYSVMKRFIVHVQKLCKTVGEPSMGLACYKLQQNISLQMGSLCLSILLIHQFKSTSQHITYNHYLMTDSWISSETHSGMKDTRIHGSSMWALLKVDLLHLSISCLGTSSLSPVDFLESSTLTRKYYKLK